MADDWDLYAVVRSCTTSAPMAATINTAIDDGNIQKEIAFPGFASLAFQNDDTMFHFSGTIHDRKDGFQGLSEIYKDIYENPQDRVTSQNNSVSSVPILTGLQQDQKPIQLPQQKQPIQQQIGQQVMHQQRNPSLKVATLGSSLAVPMTNPQQNRPKRRKNQQSKVVHQMTQDELSADSWAWRKYGQKPIKGSPYPRNYYRCSTSKGCSARKQVERSPTDPNIFVVSYTGEHSHPRPTHRSSLAGSTRAKFSLTAKKTSGNPSPDNIVDDPSKASLSSSTHTPLIEGEKENSSPHKFQAERTEFEDEDAEMENKLENIEGDDDDDYEDILIPNTMLNEDIFKGLQELTGINYGSDSSGTGGEMFSSSLLSPPWTPTSSTGPSNFVAGDGC